MYQVARLAFFKADKQANQFAEFEAAMAQARAFKAQGSARVVVLEPAVGGSEIAAIL